MTKFLLFTLLLFSGLNVFFRNTPTPDPNLEQLLVNKDGVFRCTEERFINVTLPLNCPTLKNPTDEATDVAMDTNLSWNKVSGAVGYYLTIGTTPGGNNILDYEDVGMLTSYNLSNYLPANTTIYINITPYDAQGNITGCNEESFMTGSSVSGLIPACTEMYFPEHGAIDVPIHSIINWNEVFEADGYRLSLGTSADGTNLVNNQDIGANTAFELGNHYPMGATIYVTIIPYNEQGDAIGCVEQHFTTVFEIIAEDKTKYGFSPDGDGINEFWIIDGIENHPDNTVFIYNRWGDLVFQVQGYDNVSKVFRGEANKLTRLGAGQLPAGTYFFRIQVSGEPNFKNLNGYLVLRR